ncbi:MAG TPA: YdcF family protein [Patescibacteria group bacterium]|nr:YdcF family protein [Patescibacteria group bacterium]
MPTIEAERVEKVEDELTAVDALIVLGRNILPGYNRRTLAAEESHLSPLSKINALAAGVMYSQKRANVLILSSGHTMGRDFPSEAQAMKTFLLQHFTDIPEGNILLEETSFDTPSNAQEVKTMIADKGFTSLGLLTDDLHLKRATSLFEGQGMNVQPFNSLEILQKSQFADVVMGYTTSKLRKRVKLREGIIDTLPTPAQSVLQGVARRLRSPNR